MKSEKEIVENVSKMSDEKICEILVDKTGWQEAVFNQAVIEARKRNLKVGQGSEAEIKNQATNIQAGLVRDILDGLSIQQMVSKLEDSGIPSDFAKETVKKVAKQVGLEQDKISRMRVGTNLVICTGGLLFSIWSFMNAGAGGTFFLAWGAILFGGIKAYFAWPSIKIWETFLKEADALS